MLELLELVKLVCLNHHKTLPILLWYLTTPKFIRLLVQI